ncbi:MAG: lipid A export permease/ATP-binding protein MsbA [Gammaproteobacteria bacterium]|jgi:subfamily B ATP-binding cassette protein MsbA
MAKKISIRNVKLYLRVLKYIRDYWPSFIIALVSNVIYAASDVYFIYLLKPILNKGFITRDIHFIRWVPVLAAIVFLTRSISSFCANYFMARTSRGVIMQLRQDIFKHLLRLPATYYDNHSSGFMLANLIYNVEQVANAGADTLTTFLQSICMIVGLIFIMLSISWRLSILLLISAPIVVFTVRKINQRLRTLNLKLQHQMGDITSIAEETIEGYKVVRAFGGQQHETAKFAKATRTNRGFELKITISKSIGSIIPQTIVVAILILTVWLSMSHQSILMLSAGGFAALFGAMLTLLKPLKNFTKVNALIQRGLSGAENVFAVIDEPIETDNGTTKIKTATGAIAFKNVNFSYPNTEKLVLQDINFEIAPGQIVALVGQSGGGKSTIVNLLQHFYDGYTGAITLDNINIRDIVLTDLREQFAFVSQHVSLFNDSAKHNIAYGKFENASEQDIIAAAKAANAWNFIKQLPQGLDTLLGENGVLLSGGQRQRIAIARAILKNAPILILDEATSALDTESEREIQTALQKLMQHCTTLVIAHRLSTIENADKILLIEHGRIVESGNHQELLAHNGRYAKLHKMQFKEA